MIKFIRNTSGEGKLNKLRKWKILRVNIEQGVVTNGKKTKDFSVAPRNLQGSIPNV